jgi:hypothetical protein
MQVNPKPPQYQADQYTGSNTVAFSEWFSECWGVEFTHSVVSGTLKLTSTTGYPYMPFEVPMNSWVVFGPFDLVVGTAGNACWVGPDSEFTARYDQVP